MRFDGISRTELIEFIHELEIQITMYKRALESALRDGRQYLETATRAQERGTELQFKIQSLESSGLSIEQKSTLIAGPHIK